MMIAHWTHLRLSAFLLLVVAVKDASANPIAVDIERRPMEMLAEDVVVVVGAQRSAVLGEFRFRLQPATARGQKHVTFFIPVLLPAVTSVERYMAENGPPRVTVEGRTFAAVLWNDLTPEGAPDPVRLPKGWWTVLYSCQVPLNRVRDAFAAQITYCQPHFAGGIAAYVPIRPPRDGRFSSVTFRAEPGRKLRRVTGFPLLAPARSEWQFTPKDHELLRVQSVPRTNGR